MQAVRDNLTLRAWAWALFFVSVCAAAFFGQQAAFACCYAWFGSWETTAAFHQALLAREGQVQDFLQYRLELEQGDLDYVEREQYAVWLMGTETALSPEHTNFRYEILNEDGGPTEFGNADGQLGSLEEQVSGLYYGVIRIQDGVVELMDREIKAPAGFAALEEAGRPGETVQETGILRCGGLRPEQMTAQDEFYDLYGLYGSYTGRFGLYGALGAVSAGAAVLLLGFLLWTAGRRPQGAVLSWPDRVFSEVWALAAGLGSLLFFLFLTQYVRYFEWAVEAADRDWLLLLAGAGTAAAGLWALLAAAALRTLAVRVKCRALARTTLLCRVVKFLWRRICSFVRELPITWKTVLFFFTYLTAVFLADHLWPLRGLYPLLSMLIHVAALLLLTWWSAGFWRVRKGTEVIAAGNLNHQIDAAHLPADLKRHAEALNNISGGLTQAVNEQMKSERFKAELITNVSHDLKTPLTSIINYVALLKTTEQTDPQAQMYIDVLDRKSQRLKKLTEDLVEASKASTGALPVNREKIGMVQLLDQALGEYEERLEGKKLAVVRTVPESECFVFADGRHLWRVIDNLLSNCAKYALEGTRVYLEICRGKGSVSLSVKNISREPLNVPPERLMERFVRGEESRTTEGSGLGLSIAKSLTELQGGSFELAVDGDLFKAIVTLPQAS